MKGNIDDPKALIIEGYNIDGITYGECRTIFLAWTLGVPADQDPQVVITRLLGQYSARHAAHPMTQVLQEGLVVQPDPVRRGGWRGRRKQ
jgi:hypothetical protein